MHTHAPTGTGGHTVMGRSSHGLTVGLWALGEGFEGLWTSILLRHSSRWRSGAGTKEDSYSQTLSRQFDTSTVSSGTSSTALGLSLSLSTIFGIVQKR